MINLQQIKRDIIDQSKANDHRMTRFNGTPIVYRGRSFYTALCMDCFGKVEVESDGTVMMVETLKNECSGRIRH